MVDYASPVETTFELQRKSIEQGQQAIEQTVSLPQRFGEAAVDSLDSQESVQRSVVELQQETLNSLLDAVEESLPGAESPTADLREVIDDQYAAFLDNHEEFFDNLEESLEESVDAYDELSEESIEALDELVDALMEVQEELEDQSVEATEQVGEQVDEIQDQVEDVQEQIQEVSEEAADAVEN
jgi:methyl-accepting chemotaxis protein